MTNFGELPGSLENREMEPRDVYINKALETVKKRLHKYFPILSRDIPTKVNYEDNAKELKINHDFDFDSGKLDINIKTTENLSGQTADNLENSETNFSVFQDKAGNEKILKKIQDLFFVVHEYGHGINRTLFREMRPDMVELAKAEKSREKDMSDEQKIGIRKNESETVPSILGESFAMSLEKMVADKILDDQIDPAEKENVKKFVEIKEKSLSSKKLEGDQSDYTVLDESLIFYRIYKKFEEKGTGEGEKAIIRFAKNFDFDKIAQIQRYSDPEKKALSPEYKNLLGLSKNDPELFMEKFAKDKV